MTTRTNRSRPAVKALATASAAGFALIAATVPASATESGNYKDAGGNLANTEQDIHCTAKIEAGYFPPAVGFNGALLVTYGQGNCTNQTTFDHGIVDIQEYVNGNWMTVPGGLAAQFNTPLQWTQAYAPGVGNAGTCTEYRARTRVWRRADANKADPTIAVKSAGVFIGQGGICAKL